jgi:hypothetical protein
MKVEVKQSRKELRSTLCRLVRTGNYADPSALRALLDKDWYEGTDSYSGQSLETRGTIAYATHKSHRYDVTRRRQTTLVRYLRTRWPTECGPLSRDIERLGEEYLAETASFDDVVEWSGSDVTEIYNSGIAHTCMAGETDLIELFAINDEQVSVLTWAGKARALLWTDDDGQRYLDRCYPSPSTGSRVLRRYAAAQGWYARQGDSYRTDGFLDSDGNRVTLSLRLNVPSSELMPFLDTLQYGSDWDGDRITLSSSAQGAQYTFDSTDGGGLVATCSCECCGDRVLDDEVRYPSYDLGGLCVGCYEDTYTCCECCGDECRRDDCVETRDHYDVCPDCLTANYRQCAECGEYVPDDDFRDDPDGDVCDDCYVPEEEGDE